MAEAAGEAVRQRYEFVAVRDADVVVALGGDGFLLHILHEALLASEPKPVFGMNRGTVGFMMNEFGDDDLPARIAAAAGEENVSAGEFAAQAVGQFVNGASDEEWLTLIGLMSRADNPGQIFLRRVLSNALPRSQECGCG